MSLKDLLTDPAFFALLTGSYAQLVGTPLVPQGKDASWLYSQAPFAVVAHNTDADPKFIYANMCAQACFEYSWEEFIGLPSRLSAEGPERAERGSARRRRQEWLHVWLSRYSRREIRPPLPHREWRGLGAHRRERDRARSCRDLPLLAESLSLRAAANILRRACQNLDDARLDVFI